MLTLKRLLVFTLMAAFTWVVPAAAQNSPNLDNILAGIEKRYAGKGFSATFFQESILKAMQITDTAEGTLTVKSPGKMHWAYTIPEVQKIITDGKEMWIYRPTDNQVMVGKAPSYFGGGKGAGFLSDIRQIRKSFRIQLQPAQNDQYHRLKMVPLKPTPELADIVISVSKNTFQIDQVVTHNAYGDETRFILDNYQFNINPDESLFHFTIPKGVEVIKLEQF